MVLEYLNVFTVSFVVMIIWCLCSGVSHLCRKWQNQLLTSSDLPTVVNPSSPRNFHPVTVSTNVPQFATNNENSTSIQAAPPPSYEEVMKICK